jgi:hypothetical protein
LESFCSGFGSGSYSGSGSRQYLAQFSKNEKIAQNLAFSVSEAAYFPESWPPISDFFVLFFTGFTTLVLSRPGSGLEFPV